MDDIGLLNPKLKPEVLRKKTETYLDGVIEFWREKLMHDDELDDLLCRCYIDAYQSARVSLIGETLPSTPELDVWIENNLKGE